MSCKVFLQCLGLRPFFGSLFRLYVNIYELMGLNHSLVQCELRRM